VGRKRRTTFHAGLDDEFIDVPEVDDQKQPTVDRDEMTAILREAEEPYGTLYALLAGCGPMRAREALGLDIRSIHEDVRTLEIVQKVKLGELQDHMKTKNADSMHGRVVDLSESLAAMLREFVGGRTSGLMFCKPDGSQLMQRDILKHSLHPILKNNSVIRNEQAEAILERMRLLRTTRGRVP
jgi:integrase